VNKINRFDVVQFKLAHKWAGCLMVVTEIRTLGVQGYVQVPERGRAYIRAGFDEIIKIGEAVFVPVDEEIAQ
jgi:hypothetical protein